MFPVQASLKKLRTSYIDYSLRPLWDYDTSVEEVMNGLHNLVAQERFFTWYVFSFLTFSPTFLNSLQGISDTPAWLSLKPISMLD